ncbi:MAG TPA: nucleotidyltransferase domain-containing protein [Candidatus Kapabacteria bacterium]|nr:nucleotidyltransferase domain-containing protein [Candidatus Kapabacteria bacterium]
MLATIPADVQKEILVRLEAIEAAGNVRILFAVESGSRAWGFPSRNSDYDVRFIYVRTPDWYLSIDMELRRDVIERPITDDIDLAGWDIRKALRLFAKSNPPMLEWLSSPIVYREDPCFFPRILELLPLYFSSVASMHHYRNMARRTRRSHLAGDLVSVKKYFYVLRPLLAVRWLEQERGPVPMAFAELLPTIDHDPQLQADIETLRQRKMSGEELDRKPAIPSIDAFIEQELARLEEVLVPRRAQPVPLDDLHVFFRSVLEHAWR